MLIKRIASGVVLVGIILLTIFIDWVCALAVTVFVGVGLYEFFTMLEKKDIRIYKYFGMALGLFVPIMTFFDYRYNFEITRKMELLFIVLAMLALILMQFKRRKSSGAIVDISTTLFGILYISWFFSFLIKIRCLEGGLGFLAAVLLMTKLGDIGAYFVGMRFGKIPLLPRISPKKTVEGAIAGLIFSVLGALASQPMVKLPYLQMVFLGISMGILGQLGDLSESLLKRDCQVKDSGSILPGMGGILDEIDSLLFTAPAFYFFINALIVR